jgi:predicted nucleic acid-binding protein
MSIEKVVINASPFILLCKTDLIEILPGLFNEIFMPESVSQEIDEGRDAATQKLYDCEKTWLIRCLIGVSEDVLVWNLGQGESEVLSFALENGSEYAALVDDRAARKCAATLGIKVFGTAGILVLGKKRGLIENVSDELKKLRNAGLWISDDVYNAVLKSAGEL